MLIKLIVSLLFILISFSSLYAYTSVDSIPQDEIDYALGIKPKMNRDSWNTQRYNIGTRILAIAGLDLWQTYTFRFKDKKPEQSDYLGENCSKKKVFGMAALWGISHIGIAVAIPKRWLRTTWQLTFIVIHLDAVMKNYEMGVRVGF